MQKLSKENIESLISLAKETHQLWDTKWTEVEESLSARNEEILCGEGCSNCCFTRRFATLSESVQIADYMNSTFSLAQFEEVRLRVEHSVSCLNKLREDEVCDSDTLFYRNGGLECPLLKHGSCSIYAVRPIDCRSQIITSKTNRDDCRKCPRVANFIDAEAEYVKLRKHLLQKEEDLGFRPLEKNFIPEVLSTLWAHGMPSKTYQLTEKAIKNRLESRNKSFDQTWLDDRHDLYATSQFPLVLPEEGEYGDDLIILRLEPEFQEIYGETYRATAGTELRVLYKLNLGSKYDWNAREFVSEIKNTDPFVVWMGDSMQERLMMWEAAKRCRGKVLCGGLGMGIFPQYALSLPRVESVSIVEMNPITISILKETWRKNPWSGVDDCEIEQSKIEDFLRTTDEKFDTVYIDTWDALTEEYLPHVNLLRELSERVLNPGGEIIMWGYDLMLRLCLKQAKNILDRRKYFLDATEGQMKIMKNQTPVFYMLIDWIKSNPTCKENEFYDAAYQIATQHSKDLGVLSLDNHKG